MNEDSMLSPQSIAPPSSPPAQDADRPPPTPPHKSHGSKPKARPTITPRTFTRFFTPRTSLPRGAKVGAARQALRDITASAANRNLNSWRRSPKKDSIDIFEDDDVSTLPATKKRRLQGPFSPDLTPVNSSPLNRLSKRNPDVRLDDTSEETSSTDEGDPEDEKALKWRNINGELPRPPRSGPILRSIQRGMMGGILSRQAGLESSVLARHPVCDGRDWQYETADFYTLPEDQNICDNLGDPTEHAIPFCSTSCNTNSLVAIGDEEGGIRLLETAAASKPQFTKAYLTFRPHTNAILDLAFSPDDLLLATASGDQTSQIIDMPTQRAVHTLAAHKSSLKQVKFQPGNPNVVVTSSRDGSVRIWDLRCKGSDAPVQDLKISLDGLEERVNTKGSKMTYARSVDAIISAHSARIMLPSSSVLKSADHLTTSDVPSRGEKPSRRGDVSVTALSFLPEGREHLLLTASEADSTVKLWDLRTTHQHRRSTQPVPLSSTRQPQSHNTHRHFGINSMALSGDSARLYTLCRDNTIYAYSTTHLILGSAPELSSTPSDLVRKPRFGRTTEKEGLGPIYGLRHSKFHATTFYVKLSIRPAQDDRSELLAAGSSDGCAMIWPTDERYLRHMDRARHPNPDALMLQDGYATPPPLRPGNTNRPPLARMDSGLNARLKDTIPIYSHGTPLVRGHSSEVTGLSWAHGGELITVSDDFTARCWREDGERARELRIGGEGEGKRWGCGWADVGEEGWDEL
ncbi:MAG: hypothetical protein LQ352_007503 [Teloschistes flavicans]|nr:MAG: hypothetical protein LQ352_007503 [Teloschistes flavicans]